MKSARGKQKMSLISREAAIRKLQDKGEEPMYQHTDEDWKCGLFMAEDIINDLPAAEVTLCHLDSPCEYQNADIEMPSAQPEQEDYTELKREFLRMASYIDVLLECSDAQKETLIGFISRLAEFMPWTERD